MVAWILTAVLFYCVGQDATEQAAIDNFIVQQLDGTVNEWGWCKQKVLFMTAFCNDFIVHANHTILYDSHAPCGVFSLEQMPFWQCLLQSAKLGLVQKKSLFTRYVIC